MVKNPKKFSIKLLKYLESVFPQDMATAQKRMNYEGWYDQEAIKTLVQNGLVEEVKYPFVIEKKTKDLTVWKITSKGIDFLNGLRQKKTNLLLLILTIITTIIGILQLVILAK